jgi:hypothetical protein
MRTPKSFLSGAHAKSASAKKGTEAEVSPRFLSLDQQVT